MRGKDLRYFSKEVENLSKRRTGVIIAGLIHDKESGNWRYRDPIKKNSSSVRYWSFFFYAAIFSFGALSKYHLYL